MSADDHPDAWAPGLRLRLKALNVKTVARAADPGEVLPVCLSHNLRTGNEDHRHRSRIDPARTGANEVLRGPACPLVAAELVRSVLEELGIVPARRDTIMGVEAVIQAPEGADVPAFWSECLTWAAGRYQHIVSAIVHRDQSRPHLHVIALAVAGGRLAGNALTSGAGRFTLQKREFLAHMRDRLGLRPDRPMKTLAALALTTGKGAKTHAAAARRDAKLDREAGADWKRETLGMGVHGHGGSETECVETSNPHAQEKSEPPLLRIPSTSDTTSYRRDMKTRRPAPKTADFWRHRRPPAVLTPPPHWAAA
ncbi:plasmid recombination protein [Sphaerotilus sp.]|uniref:plasmid recombination protein n=1 Tax=Sphaerotilus sp. TaxID=2093942 RepID=UPI0025D4F48B|nr:plasmid recombination protein [Sphaerotilus sp.]